MAWWTHPHTKNNYTPTVLGLHITTRHETVIAKVTFFGLYEDPNSKVPDSTTILDCTKEYVYQDSFYYKYSKKWSSRGSSKVT